MKTKMRLLGPTLCKEMFILLVFIFFSLAAGATKPVISNNPSDEPKSGMQFWLTLPDQSVLFQKQPVVLTFENNSNEWETIEVDTAVTYQSVDGFGYTLTGGSALLINSLDAKVKKDLLKELFSTHNDGIGVSYLRISIGASDLSDTVFTYDEMPTGQTDEKLDHFSIHREKADLIPLLKQILEIAPYLKILGSPWTAPTWMKTNKSYKGGSLKPEYYNAYARYFVKYIQAMEKEGITIDAITVQNEPLHPGNVPSMYMEAADQSLFIKNHLGPIFQEAAISTKIIVYDHNADRPDYPITILNDPDAKKFIDGSAFHLYGGNVSALSEVHKAHPDKNVYFTEQWVGGPSNFGGDLGWHIENLVIGATRNWSRNVLEWNLASDPSYDPHTDGGCTNCLGALTITDRVSRNVAYYIIAHASKFVRPGSVRILSNGSENLSNVAFISPTGQKILIVFNKSVQAQTFNIKFNGKQVTTFLEKGAVGTFVW